MIQRKKQQGKGGERKWEKKNGEEKKDENESPN